VVSWRIGGAIWSLPLWSTLRAFGVTFGHATGWAKILVGISEGGKSEIR
jgi:hypothetical protein